MIRLFVSAPLKAKAAVALAPEQAHYLINVMRRAEGAKIALFNGVDGEWTCEIVEARKKGCVLACVARTRAHTAPPDLDLIIALVKRPRLETIIEKATELGARRIFLVTTERTNAERAKVARLQAIAVEAAEQTGRLDVPEIAEPVKLKALIDKWDAGRRLLFCDEAGDAPPALEALSGQGDGPWAILIGPEGGFSPAERKRLRDAPFTVAASLGPRILRADTAAISALTLWQAAVGDWRA